MNVKAKPSSRHASRSPRTMAFGCARHLYEQHCHPRILCDADGLDQLRRAMRRGPGLRLMTALRHKLAPVIARVLAANDPDALLKFDGWQSFGWIATYALREIALVGVLDKDADAVEAARRILAMPHGHVWSHGFGPQAFDLLYDRLPSEDRRRFVTQAADLVRKQVADGRSHYLKHAGHNMTLCSVMVNALMALLAIKGEPESGDLSREERALLTFFEATLHVVFNPNGYPEEDIGYGTDVAAVMAEQVEALRRAGLYDAYTQCPRYRLFGRALLHFVQPWGEYLAMTGDHANCIWFRQLILARLATENRDPTLLWLLGVLRHDQSMMANPTPLNRDIELRKGFRVPVESLSLLVLDDLARRPVSPAQARVPTAYRDPGRGIVSFRSGWRADDTFMVFDGSQRSPSAQGHFHASGGHFSLSALGEQFAIDMGRYNTEQNCHNVVLIDGQSGRATDGQWGMTFWHGNLIDYRPGAFCDFAAADSSQQHNCYWARRFIGLVKGAGRPAYAWTVEDINKANDWAAFWWTLNTCPENTIALGERHAVVRGWKHGHLMDVHFILPSPQAYPKPHTLTLAQDEPTTSSYRYIPNPHARVQDYVRPAAQVNHIVFVRPRLIAKVGGYNGRFMTLLLPRHQDRPPPTVEPLATTDNALAVRIADDRTEDILIWAYEHHLLEAGPVKARGQWCVVRRALRTSRVLAWELGRGSRLEVGGQVVKVQDPAKRL